MALGSTQSLTEMSTGLFPGGKGGRCVRLTTLPPSCAFVMKSGNLNYLEPSGPLQACNGNALLCFAYTCSTQLHTFHQDLHLNPPHYPYIHFTPLFSWLYSPSGPRPRCWGFGITLRHHTRWDSSGRVISSKQRPVPDNTQTHKRQTCQPPAGLEPTIPETRGSRPTS